MVTTVLLPAVRDSVAPEIRMDFFEAVEGRFARQARLSTALAGLTGFWLAWRMDAWWRFADPAWWWMHAMVALWAVFTLMLFVLEPLFLHAWFRRRAARDPEGTFRLVHRLHVALLAAGAATILGVVAGAHGGWRVP